MVVMMELSQWIRTHDLEKNMALSGWPFDQDPNCAVITLRSIVFEGKPILRVTHDEEDHGWQFLDGGIFDMANAAVVSLDEIVRRDPSVLEIWDLPPGWCACRESPSLPWRREKKKS